MEFQDLINHSAGRVCRRRQVMHRNERSCSFRSLPARQYGLRMFGHLDCGTRKPKRCESGCPQGGSCWRYTFSWPADCFPDASLNSNGATGTVQFRTACLSSVAPLQGAREVAVHTPVPDDYALPYI